ncbi:MAG: ribulose-phosphate 3-epimerase [Clostridiales bacterium]|nr:ribulose-phosphate 3-epimerase [Clostridiales bacterium]
MKLYPSLMCVDFARLHTEIPALHNTGVAGYHIDIMDGNFVPNFALGSNDIKAVASLSDKELDVHLMVNNADQAIHSFLDLPVQRICFHHEACVHHHRVVSLIRQKGMKAGIAVNPGTSVSAIADILPELDFVLVMSVNPGFAGQKYLDFTTDKMRELVRIRRERGLRFEIEVDGATAPDKIELLSGIGVDSFVLGTAALFGKGRPYGDIVPELLALEK